jgi:tryptophan synthase alpha subunit
VAVTRVEDGVVVGSATVFRLADSPTLVVTLQV